MMRGVAIFSVGLQLALLTDGVRGADFDCDVNLGLSPEANVWAKGLMGMVKAKYVPTAPAVATDIQPVYAYIAKLDTAHDGCVPCTVDNCGKADSTQFLCVTIYPTHLLCDWVNARVTMVHNTPMKDGMDPTAISIAGKISGSTGDQNTGKFLSDVHEPTVANDGTTDYPPTIQLFKDCRALQYKWTEGSCGGKCGCKGKTERNEAYTKPVAGDKCKALQTALDTMANLGTNKGLTYKDTDIVPTDPTPEAVTSFAQLVSDAGSWVAITGVALAVPALGYAAYSLGPKFFGLAETEEMHEPAAQSKQEDHRQQAQPAQTLAEPAFAAGVVALVILGAMLVLASLGSGKKGAHQEEDISDEEDRA